MDFQPRILPTRECLRRTADGERIRDDDATRVDLVLSLAACADTVRHTIYDPLQGAHGISEGKFSLLMMLYAEGPKLTTELACSLGVSAATVSVMVKRMLAAPSPLIVSEKLDTDARARRITLSEHGRSLVQALLPEHFASMRAASERLTRSECETLTLLLRKLLGQQ